MLLFHRKIEIAWVRPGFRKILWTQLRDPVHFVEITDLDLVTLLLKGRDRRVQERTVERLWLGMCEDD